MLLVSAAAAAVGGLQERHGYRQTSRMGAALQTLEPGFTLTLLLLRPAAATAVYAL
jgi:hypothetical protein